MEGERRENTGFLKPEGETLGFFVAGGSPKGSSGPAAVGFAAGAASACVVCSPRVGVALGAAPSCVSYPSRVPAAVTAVLCGDCCSRFTPWFLILSSRPGSVTCSVVCLDTCVLRCACCASSDAAAASPLPSASSYRAAEAPTNPRLTYSTYKRTFACCVLP